MTDWYRRTEWDEAIAADFEARLARTRPSGRAQYLSLQGFALIAGRPDAAQNLLERAVDLAEPSELPRASCYLALARLARSDVDGALAAYDVAIEAERLNPMFRSTAAVDQALLIGLFERGDRYSEAIDRLAVAGTGTLDVAAFEATAAEALIRAGQGRSEEARTKAQRALALYSGDVPELEWGGFSFADIKRRLEAIA